jgi:hypothetical protein
MLTDGWSVHGWIAYGWIDSGDDRAPIPSPSQTIDGEARQASCPCRAVRSLLATRSSPSVCHLSIALRHSVHRVTMVDTVRRDSQRRIEIRRRQPLSQPTHPHNTDRSRLSAPHTRRTHRITRQSVVVMTQPPSSSAFSCVLDRRGVRSLHRTLICLSKIGHEVNIEATHDSLLLRALAPSHAVFALVTLRRQFFAPSSFASRPNPPSQQSQPPHASSGSSQSLTYLKCKVQLKHFMLVFRRRRTNSGARHKSAAFSPDMGQQSAHDRQAAACEQQHDRGGCDYDRMRAACWWVVCSLPFESQSNILQADFQMSSESGYLIFKPQLFSKALDNFSPRMTEVTLIIDPEPTAEELKEHPQLQHINMIRLKNFDQNQANAPTAGLSLLQENINTESDIPQAQLDACHVSRPATSATEAGTFFFATAVAHFSSSSALALLSSVVS